MRCPLILTAIMAAVMGTGCRMPLAPAEGGGSSDEFRREPRPSFDIKQTEAERQSIVSDGASHTMSVLFSDKVTARVRLNEGQVRDRYGKGVVFSKDFQTEYGALNDILDDFPSLNFSSRYDARTTSEEQLLAEETKMSAAFGVDYPNQGSWVILTLDPYSSEAILDLARRLDSLSFVRMAQIQGSISGHIASLSTD